MREKQTKPLSANELRRGNIAKVLNDPDDHYGIVESIHATAVRLMYGDCATVCDADGIGGVPLTADWLIRMGLDKERDNDYRIVLPNGDVVDLSIELLDTEAVLVRQHAVDGVLTRDFDYCYIKPIKYVHQLQNVFFALTTQELILNQK
jgi:hypothetical protein